jgi:hypothetical protein
MAIMMSYKVGTALVLVSIGIEIFMVIDHWKICPERLWGPPSLLSNGYLPGGKAAEAWSWPFTSIQCRGQRMSGYIPPLPQYAFMARCFVKAWGQLYLYLYVNFITVCYKEHNNMRITRGILVWWLFKLWNVWTDDSVFLSSLRFMSLSFLPFYIFHALCDQFFK